MLELNIKISLTQFTKKLNWRILFWKKKFNTDKIFEIENFNWKGMCLMARMTAKILVQKYGLNVKHALYSKLGDWYHLPNNKPNQFPAALLDKDGYILFQTEVDYSSFIQEGKVVGIKEYRLTNHLGLKRVPLRTHANYVLFLGNFPDEIANPFTVFEGAKRQITVNFYERDSSARNRCIKRWGENCAVCEFNFKAIYGDIGEGFIHVHHLTPIASIKHEYELVPESDLRPVCPNCHAMLHRKEPTLSIEELKMVIAKKFLDKEIALTKN